MEVKKIKCSRLNEAFRGGTDNNVPDLEVFVGFENGDPVGVMCNEYNAKNGKCKLAAEDCTYNEWKRFYSK